MLPEKGVAGLSLRQLAVQAGVSHNAPYMHFADKEALLAAISEEGFRLLSAAIITAMDDAGEDWFDQLHAGCYAYVAFVIDHSGHAQVMFHEYDPETYPDLLLVLVPRHPERFSRVAALARRHGFTVARHSEGQASCADVDVYLGDTFTEPSPEAGGGAQQRTAGPVDPAPPLPSLVGRYESEELRTFWDVAVEDGGLVMRQKRHGAIPLAHVSGTEFTGYSDWSGYIWPARLASAATCQPDR